MSFRIFLTAPGISPQAREHLERQGAQLLLGEPKATPEELARTVSGFLPDALIVRTGRITSAVMDASPGLKAICKHGVGIDNIDVQAATAKGIPVMYTPFANYESVAEHALALILALTRKVAEQDRAMRAGGFDKKSYQGLELYGKTLGLVGFGKSARRLCELVAPFRMDVIVYHPSQTMEALPPNVRKARSVGEVLSSADVLSLHCPLTDATRNMIDARSIRGMRPGVHIVNTARGGLVNEADLCAALQDGSVAGAALDVYESEPPPPKSPLFALPNIVLTPHVAGSSDNSLVNMGMESARNVLAVLRGEPVDEGALVDPGVYQPRTSAPG
jgi:D-3-phosphoglycerate dehydrogenase